MTPETKFKSLVKNYLDEMGAYHVPYIPGVFGKSGVPDILACLNGKFLGIELKSENRKPSELQKYHIQKIREAGGVGLILYPSEFSYFQKMCREMTL